MGNSPVTGDALEAPDSAAAAVLDYSVLDVLGGQFQPEFVDRVITMFMESALTLLAELKRGLAEGDVRVLHHASHTLKSCSATIYFACRPLQGVRIVGADRLGARRGCLRRG